MARFVHNRDARRYRDGVLEVFRGQMTLTDGETVPVELEVSSDVLRIVSNGASIGAWPIRYCRVSPRATGTFDISIDGELVSFNPTDRTAFAETAAARFVSSPLSDRIAAVKTLPVGNVSDPLPAALGEPDPTPLKLEGRRMLVGAGLAAVVVSLVFVGTQLRRPSQPIAVPQPTITATTSLPVPVWFELTPAEFASRWNLKAAEIDVEAALPTSVRGGFDVTISEWIYIQGTAGEDGTMNSVVITVDPTGPVSSDQHAILVWGLAMTVVDPTGAPAERRAILERLGVDLDDIQLDGVDNGLDWGRNRFTMQYLPGLSSVLLRIQPAG